MAEINIVPMPESYRKIPAKYRPDHPPIWPDGDPTPEDRQLALDLFCALDPESRWWYAGSSRTFVDLPIPDELLLDDRP